MKHRKTCTGKQLRTRNVHLDLDVAYIIQSTQRAKTSISRKNYLQVVKTIDKGDRNFMDFITTATSKLNFQAVSETEIHR